MSQQISIAIATLALLVPVPAVAQSITPNYINPNQDGLGNQVQTIG